MEAPSGTVEQLRAELGELKAELAEVRETLTAKGIRLPRLLDVKEVAGILGISTRKLEDLVKEGALRPLWIGNQRRFSPESVDAYLRTCARRKR